MEYFILWQVSRDPKLFVSLDVFCKGFPRMSFFFISYSNSASRCYCTQTRFKPTHGILWHNTAIQRQNRLDAGIGDVVVSNINRFRCLIWQRANLFDLTPFPIWLHQLKLPATVLYVLLKGRCRKTWPTTLDKTSASALRHFFYQSDPYNVAISGLNFTQWIVLFTAEITSFTVGNEQKRDGGYEYDSSNESRSEAAEKAVVAPGINEKNLWDNSYESVILDHQSIACRIMEL